MRRQEIIVFDMDGVLVEVSESYRETICRTVGHFTGRKPARELVQEYKNRGGFNNDWLLSQTIARDFGAEVAYEVVIEKFNSIFYGDGLMSRERWIPANGLLEDLGRQFGLAIFTGRSRQEANITLRRFARDIAFDPFIGAEDVIKGKPDPEGLLKISAMHPEAKLLYIGDTVDDARSSQAAGVPFIGIGVAQRDLFENAVAVLENVNQLPAVVNRP